MLLVKNFILVLSLLFLIACEHGTAVVGEGDVVAIFDPSRSCSSELGECRFRVLDAYEEAYFAVAGPQHVFIKWDVCLAADGILCVFNIGEDTVKENYGKRFTSTQASFAPISPTRFDAVWEGTGVRNGVNYTMSCITLADNTLRCEGAEEGDDMFFGAALTLNGNNIVGGTGKGQSTSGALVDVVVQGGSFVAHDSLQVSLTINGEAASLDLLFETGYRVPRPLTLLEGLYDAPVPGEQVLINLDGSFAFNFGDEPNCSMSGSMVRPVALGYVAVFDVSMTRQGCSSDNGAMEGFAYEFNLDDEEYLYLFGQLQGLDANNGGFSSYLIRLGDPEDGPL